MIQVLVDWKTALEDEHFDQYYRAFHDVYYLEPDEDKRHDKALEFADTYIYYKATDIFHGLIKPNWHLYFSGKGLE